MKKIIFIRHAKAEDQSPEITDFERSLTLKGKVVSGLMAKKLKEKEKSLGTIITSPAFRAIETALIFAGEYGIKSENIILQSRLYFSFDEKSLMEILGSVNETVGTVTLFGHNPSFTDLAGYLCKEAFDVIPKTGIVSLSFNARTWSEIKPNSGNADLILKPKKVL
jgi:phosphohistidine phosphatase